MPKILEETVISLDRADLDRRLPLSRPITPPARSSGIHLSGVLRYIAKTAGLSKVLDEIDQEAIPLRWALGIMWEEFCISLYPYFVWQPGECESDDVYMTCDAIAYIDQPFLGEFKCTAKKVRSGPEMLKEWLWMQQGRGYCHGYRVTLIDWHVLFYMGDYRNSGPIYKRYLIEYDPKEIDQTWRSVLANKSRAIEEVHAATT